MNNATTTSHLRDLNARRILAALKERSEATCRDLAHDTGLTSVTVAAALGALADQGRVEAAGAQGSTGGRPAQVFRFRADHRLVLAVYSREVAGVDTQEFRVADLHGRVVHRETLVGTPRSLADWTPTIDRLIVQWPAVAALGFGLPGIHAGGRVVALDYPGLVGEPLVNYFHNRTGLPVIFENDVNCAAWGWARRRPQAESLAYVYFPRKYSPGAGLVWAGRLIRGRGGWAGEVGQLPLGIDWERPHLHDDPVASTEAVVKTLAALVGTLDPEAVVVHAEFLTPARLEALGTAWPTLVPRLPPPPLELSAAFSRDFEEGLVHLTLHHLESVSP